MSRITDFGLDPRCPTFSFYLTSHQVTSKPQILASAAKLADAVTIAGPAGPETFARKVGTRLGIPTFFDGLGYKPDQEPLDPKDWVRRQRRVGSVRPLLPGIFLHWDKDGALDSLIGIRVQEQDRIASSLGASTLVALDARWLTRRTEVLMKALQSMEAPIAIVLAHRSDPLAPQGAIQGLRRVVSRVDRLSVLRTDHGGVGALAFGAEHASIGLMTSTRHYATSDMGAWRRPGRSARLFVRPLLDWFLAGDIAGWAAAGNNFICSLPCCNGRGLERFLDPEADDETSHNMNALANFASYICNATAEDRVVEFFQQCHSAVSRYGLAGFKGPENPKAQLTSWSFL